MHKLIAHNLSTGVIMTFAHNNIDQAFKYIALSTDNSNQSLSMDADFDNTTIKKGEYGYHMGDWSIAFKDITA